jgi:ABC-2 type transport system ATP-binding protein
VTSHSPEKVETGLLADPAGAAPLTAVPDQARSAPAAIALDGVRMAFGAHVAVADVSLSVGAGEIHALLGPNGAGKTTLLRILAGLVVPSAGTVTVLGRDGTTGDRALRQSIGLVPSGDRSFYLRITGLENLVFFGRLHGFRKRRATQKAYEVLELVGLTDAARKRVGEYSHGMQKRLSVARALLTHPAVLLVDEATHDLDPQGARAARELVQEIAARGTAVVWATQRLDEIRGFADRVLLLDRGEARFRGSVPELMAQTARRRYLLHLRNGGGEDPGYLERVLDGMATVRPSPHGEPGHYVLTLADDAVLGEAISSLTAARVQVLSCHEERSLVEEAFMRLTSGEGEL